MRVVQAALTGVSAAYDARGRRLAWLDTSHRGAVVVTLWLLSATSRTLYDRHGDCVPYGNLAEVAIVIVIAVMGARGRALARRRVAGTRLDR